MIGIVCPFLLKITYYVPHFNLNCPLFPWNYNSKIAIWNNLASIIFKIFPTAPTMVVALKILQPLSPLKFRITTRALSLSLIIWKKWKLCPSFRKPPLPYKNPRYAPVNVDFVRNIYLNGFSLQQFFKPLSSFFY